MAIIRIARQHLQPNDNVAGLRGGHTHFRPKFIGFVRFALGQTFHFEGMHTIEFVCIRPFLCENPLNVPSQLLEPLALFGNRLPFPLYIAIDAPQIHLQPFLHLPGAL